MIKTLTLTILIESSIIYGYAQLRKKPLVPLLLTGFLVNLLTQSFLWLGLNVFPFQYSLALLSMEILIVGIESLLLYIIKKNQLNLQEAFLLSLSMNLFSFTIGLFISA